MTRVLTVHPQTPEKERIAEAAAAILRGQLVAFPTETVYGLGAHALDPRAVEKIFTAKGRPAQDPLIVHLQDADSLDQVAGRVPDIARELAAAFWPGPLTLILPRQPAVPAAVTAGLETVAVRVPSHPVALALLRASGVPIAAPSANRFGHTSPTTAQHVLNDLAGRIELLLDGGPATIGVESTVLDVTRQTPVILRPGGVPREALEARVGKVLIHENQPEQSELTAQVSPGLLGKHYAPQAELTLFLGDQALDRMASLARQLLADGQRVGLLLADEDRAHFEGIDGEIFNLGPGGDLKNIARNLYAGLRWLDGLEVDAILARDFGEQGLGLAIRDRLQRAASRVVES